MQVSLSTPAGVALQGGVGAGTYQCRPRADLLDLSLSIRYVTIFCLYFESRAIEVKSSLFAFSSLSCSPYLASSVRLLNLRLGRSFFSPPIFVSASFTRDRARHGWHLDAPLGLDHRGRSHDPRAFHPDLCRAFAYRHGLA